METVEFMDWWPKDTMLSLMVRSLVKKERQYREPIFVVKNGYPFVKCNFPQSSLTSTMRECMLIRLAQSN